MSPLVYLKKQIQFKTEERTSLSDADKETLKQWAREEMTACGVEVKG